MLYREVCKILGLFFFGFSLVLFIPLAVALYYQFLVDPSLHPQPHSSVAFLESIVVCLVFAAICYWLGRGTEAHVFKKEGIVTVVVIWFLVPLFSALPFIFSGTLTNPFMAYFETTSGYTTTGATVLQARLYDNDGKEIPIKKTFSDVRQTTYTFYGTVSPVRDPVTHKILHEGIEAVSKGVLFWRAFTQFLGGIGIVVLFVAILPTLGVSGKLLYQAEVAGPVKDALAPRVTYAAFLLWSIYIVLTLLQIVLLMVTNSEMGYFDAITTSFSTLSTGGFSVRNASIGYYENGYTDFVVLLFMVIGACNFAIYYYIWSGKLYRIYLPEVILYLTLLFIGYGVATWYLVGTEKVLLTGETGIYSLKEALRYGAFQITTCAATCGFSTADYDAWPYVLQVLMVIFMFCGGMAGSTAAGIKTIRLIMLFRIAQFKVEALFRPQTVRQFKIGGQEVDSSAANTVLCFFLLLITFSVLGTLLYVVDGIDPQTALGLVASLINNVGLAFRMADAMFSCAFLSNFSLALSSLLMLLGRLEFFVVLAIFVPAFWKRVA